MAGAGTEDLDVDGIIDKLLEVRGSRPGRQVNLTEQEIRGLCVRVSFFLLFFPLPPFSNDICFFCGEISLEKYFLLSLYC